MIALFTRFIQISIPLGCVSCIIFIYNSYKTVKCKILQDYNVQQVNNIAFGW